jgi:SAM-dependent methyltransferase
VNDRLVDRGYLTGVQYASDANLAARQAIYAYRVPPTRSVPWAVDLAGLAGEETVLDVGCGNGLYLHELMQRDHRGLVVGMDISGGMLPAARERSPAPLLVGDAQRLPFPDDAFGCVLAMHMLYHVPDRDLAIAEMRRVLQPGGVAVAVTNSLHHLEELNELVGSVLRDATGADPAMLRAYLRFSSETGGADLRRHFTSVERCDYIGELVVTAVEPIVAYVASMGSGGQSTTGRGPEILREVERRARRTIEVDGAFRARTEVGCFVCT